MLGKLRKCGLESMSQFLSNILHEPSTRASKWHRTLVAPQAHGGGLVPQISTPKELLCFG